MSKFARGSHRNVKVKSLVAGRAAAGAVSQVCELRLGLTIGNLGPGTVKCPRLVTIQKIVFFLAKSFLKQKDMDARMNMTKSGGLAVLV